MARLPRLEFPGACYHVINRGRPRQILFARRESASVFVSTLGEAAQRFHWRVHAFVVMPNHFHLALETTEPNLSLGMHRLQSTWTHRWMKLARRSDRPFQTRFRAVTVEPGAALAKIAHFIHLNPARSRVVPVTKLGAYAWSSLPLFCGGPRPAWLAGETILRETGRLPDTRAGWSKYQHFLADLAVDPTRAREFSAALLSKKRVVGSPAFKHKIAKLRVRPPRPPSRKSQEAAWAQQLAKLARLAKINLNQLPLAKTAPEKALLATAMKATTPTSNAWLARILQVGNSATLSQMARRVVLKPAMRKQLERLLAATQ